MNLFLYSFERPDRNGVDALAIDAPTCIYDVINEPGFVTLHMYVSDYIMTC